MTGVVGDTSDDGSSLDTTGVSITLVARKQSKKIDKSYQV